MIRLAIFLFLFSSCQSVARYNHPEPKAQKPLIKESERKPASTPLKPAQTKPKPKAPASAKQQPVKIKPHKNAPRYEAEGRASYYAHKFHGRKTSSGEIFNMHEMTAAHRTLPFGTLVKVTNLTNKKSVVVKINDRGPFKKDRLIDVSLEAAKRLGMIGPGIAKVRIETLN